jgi:hypothetical protein
MINPGQNERSSEKNCNLRYYCCPAEITPIISAGIPFKREVMKL